MDAMLQIVHWLTGLVVLAEALNKLERAVPCARGLSAHERMVQALKALAWLLLALGGASAVATPLLLHLGLYPQQLPLLGMAQPTVDEVLVLAGFATLIVRTRIVEG